MLAEYNHTLPWERQPCDTEKGWLAFLLFRDMPPPRSLSKLRDFLKETYPVDGFCRTSIEKWSTENGWVDRVAAYDHYLDRKRSAAVMDVLGEDAVKRAERHIELLRILQELASQACRDTLSRVQMGQKLDWDPGEIVRVVKETMTLERLVHGETTQNVGVGVSVDLTKLSLDELKTLRQLEQKAGISE